MDALGRPVGDHHDDHGDRAARDAAHRGHRTCARPGQRAVLEQAGGAHQGGHQDLQAVGDPQGQPAPDDHRRGRTPGRARPADLVPAAAQLAGRLPGPAGAVRSAARVGRPAVAAPFHGRRRAARGHPGAAGGALGRDQGPRGARRGHGEVRQPVVGAQRRDPGPHAEEGGPVRRVTRTPGHGEGAPCG
ncbi:hypothetical protein SGPA1_20337 [Streptomyces misionensis JCM 4497]